MSLPRTADVVVVGGGPTGLVLALALQKHGCSDVVVVDAVAQGENTSRALAIHAATMEALEDIGIAELLLAEGGKLNRTVVWMTGNSSPIETAFFSPLAKYTKYPFILALPQHITERVISKVAQERGIHVHRPHRVVDIQPHEADHNLTDVTFDDGHMLRARCVVGADGARSTVRRLSNIGWADPTGDADLNAKDESLSNMVIADVTLSSVPPLALDAINLLVTPTNALLFIALPGTPYAEQTTEPTYRISCAVPPALGTPPRAPDTQYMQSLFDAFGPRAVLPPGDAPRVQVKITRTLWSSRFRTHSGIAERFFGRVPARTPGGPVLLVGDAAHIHPPMGGQGMNLGIRDAIKLAPVLAAYLSLRAGPDAGGSERESESAMRTWAQQRRGRALEVIALVKRLQQMMWVPNERRWFLGTVPYNPGWLRNVFLRFVTRFEWFRANNAWRVSGLGTR
ncbi:FAD/NAD(P)-binding domain-containing protein [Daedaleopsis nitida]|nr:FAD/NAD(P)-binding domain-containing protein [Daedaleopsis nitida]